VSGFGKYSWAVRGLDRDRASHDGSSNQRRPTQRGFAYGEYAASDFWHDMIMMTQELFITRLNIAHYEAQLKLDMDDGKRSVVSRLLAEAQENLVLTTDFKIEIPILPLDRRQPWGVAGVESGLCEALEDPLLISDLR
jgi:hypothetical protein